MTPYLAAAFMTLGTGALIISKCWPTKNEMLAGIIGGAVGTFFYAIAFKIIS